MSDKMREAVLQILHSYKQVMESYDYYDSNPGVFVDDFDDIANEIVAWQAAQSERKDKPAECVNGCPDKQVCDYCQGVAAIMPCGASVTNVYEAYDAGKRAAQSVPVVGEHIRSIKIPTDTMEQEFQHHYLRGYEAGKTSNNAELERLRKDAARYHYIRKMGLREAGFKESKILFAAQDEAIDAAIAAEGE